MAPDQSQASALWGSLALQLPLLPQPGHYAKRLPTVFSVLGLATRHAFRSENENFNFHFI